MTEEKNEEQKTTFVKCLHTEMPRSIERASIKWIEFGDPRNGRWNLFPQDLVDLSNSSPTHGQIIKRKANMVAGKAINYSKDMTVAQMAEIEQFILNPNPDEDLHTVVKKMAKDYCLFGAFALEVVWTKDRTKISEVHHLDVSTLRAAPKDRYRRIPGWFYSEDWSRYRMGTPTDPGAFIPTFVPSFGYANCTNQDCQNYNEDIYGETCPMCQADTIQNADRQILYWGQYTPGNRYYAEPDYIAARSWIELDAEFGLMQLSGVLNGLTPSFIMNFIGTPSEEQKRQQWRDVQNFIGPRKYNGVMLQFSANKELVPELVTVDRNTNIDKLWVVLAEQAQSQIMTSHGVTSTMLFGVATPGKLGGNDEVKESYRIFDRDVISPIQIEISKVLNKICAVNGLKPMLTIDKNSPIEFTFSEDLLAQIMTINELREKISLEDIDPEEYKNLLGVIIGKKPATGTDPNAVPEPTEPGTGANDAITN